MADYFVWHRVKRRDGWHDRLDEGRTLSSLASVKKHIAMERSYHMRGDTDRTWVVWKVTRRWVAKDEESRLRPG